MMRCWSGGMPSLSCERNEAMSDSRDDAMHAFPATPSLPNRPLPRSEGHARAPSHLNFHFDVCDGVRGFDIESDRFARKGLYEELHTRHGELRKVQSNRKVSM